MNRTELLSALATYQPSTNVEQSFTTRFRALLTHPRAYFRDHLPGHITGSAWIVDRSRAHVLLVHHAKLHRWLQPGGHADGEEDILRVALKEAKEETGLHDFVIPFRGIFDLDIHTIPARDDFPEHLHYDIRFLLEASQDGPLMLSEESNDLRWVKLDEVAELSEGNESMMRMVGKCVEVRKSMSMT